MKIIYFTATGNSLYIAKSLSDNIYSIPKLIKENIYEFTDEKIGIVLPLYDWTIPTYVEDFLMKAKFNTNYLFAIVTYGIFSAGVSHRLLELSKLNNYNFNYINVIKMVDNYLPGFNMKTQIKNEYKKEIEINLVHIKQDIKSNRNYIIKQSKIRKSLTNFMVKKNEKNDLSKPQGIKKKVYVENTCVKCGVCTKVCSVNNIVFNKENNIEFLNKCFNCYSCLHNCPVNAIHIKNEISRNRFRNRHVTLNEIIESNE